MAKKAYVGVSNVAKKVKKMYIGVGNIAKKVKKGYVGINGIARCFFGAGDTVVYKGTAPDFSASRHQHAATTIGPYALFAYGYNRNHLYSSYAEVYTEDLVHSEVYSGSYQWGSATALSTYGVFLHGNPYFSAYDPSLTRRTFVPSSGAIAGAASGTLDDVAIFYGGGDVVSVSYCVSYVTNTLTHSFDYIARNQIGGSAACTDDYYLAAGGYGSAYASSNSHYYADYKYSDIVCVINKSHTLQSITLPVGLVSPSAVSLNGRVMFCGGISLTYMSNSSPKRLNQASDTDVVYCYDNSLTLSYPPTLSRPCHSSSAVNLFGNALVSGGRYATTGYNTSYESFATKSGYTLCNDTTYYDSTFTKRAIDPLSEARYKLASTTVGEVALFGGGCAIYDSLEPECTTAVDVYCLD